MLLPLGALETLPCYGIFWAVRPVAQRMQTRFGRCRVVGAAHIRARERGPGVFGCFLATRSAGYETSDRSKKSDDPIRSRSVICKSLQALYL